MHLKCLVSPFAKHSKCCSMSKVALTLLISALLFCTITPDLIIKTYVIIPWLHFYPQAAKGHRQDAIIFKRAYLRSQIAPTILFFHLWQRRSGLVWTIILNNFIDRQKNSVRGKKKRGFSFHHMLVKIKSMRRGNWANTLGETSVVVSAPLVTSSRRRKDI